jgi:hypothetical protein
MDLLLNTGGTDEQILSRSGYKPNESLKQLEVALNESGAVALGKAFHFSADLICSGGYSIWTRLLWDYSIQYVGIGSPRLFVYLRKRIGEVDELINKFPDELLYNNADFQNRIGEILMVVKQAPRHPKLVWPKVGMETHRDGWLRNVAVATEANVVRKVWKSDGDSSLLRVAGSEICKSIMEGATDRMLFWVRWLLEEEAILKKEHKQATLSNVDRGLAGGKGKVGQEVGQYIIALFHEVSHELTSKNMLRMTEEINCLVQLYKGYDIKLSPSQKKQIMAVLGQILCEAPRWKVPAAPPLVKDPIVISRAVAQVGKFFREVLAFPAVKNNKAVLKGFTQKTQGDKKKQSKEAIHNEQFALVEKAMEAFYNNKN